MASLMDPRDVMITDRAFRSLRDKLCILCGWTKPKLAALKNWQLQETKELSEQRGMLNVKKFKISGSFERYIGHLVARFAVICHKFCHNWEDILNVVKTIMALNNINTHPTIVKEEIFKMTEIEWESSLDQVEKWLNGANIYPIENEVKKWLYFKN